MRPTHQRANELLSYSPSTGAFSWRSGKPQCGYVEKRSGRLKIGFDREKYNAGDLAVLIVTGQWPDGVVQFINGDLTDHRFRNLRVHKCAVGRPPMDFHDRYITVPETGCWLWLGAWDVDGYGKMGGYGSISGHRISYEMFNGPIPEGFMVCHTCDTPPCVNPQHLFAGTATDNARDRERKGRSRWRKRA